MLVRQINEGRREIENEYIRAVTENGNAKASEEMAEIFELRESFEWRGLGEIPKSALRLREAYADFDAEKRFSIGRRSRRATIRPANAARSCAAMKKPQDCKLFGTPARRRRRWAPAWCRRKALARPIGPMDDSAKTRQDANGQRHEQAWPLGRKLDLRNGRVDLSHGAGGRAMARLIGEIFLAAFDNEWLAPATIRRPSTSPPAAWR